MPSKKILERYADLLINFALNNGKGVEIGQSVLVSIPESAKAMYVPLRNAVLRAGANPLMQYIAEGVDEAGYYEIASDSQLTNFFDKYYMGVAEQFDHSVMIISDLDKHALRNVDPEKLMKKQNSFKQYRKWREDKENAGKFTWTLALFGTESMAKDANMTLEEYWEEIIVACYLDQEDPVAAWKGVWEEIDRIKSRLNSLEIEKLHVLAENTDLWVKIGQNRQWLAGSGRNIPSFELFISPDCRQTEGIVSFDQPLYYLGKKIENIWLRFKEGLIVEFGANSNQDTLRELLRSENANRIGEFSLTDSRHSRISKFMGETLYDENMGQPHGNMHLAVGNAYKESFSGDILAVDSQGWDAMGYNQSPVHVDIITSKKREVIAYLADGSELSIYKDGQFAL